MPGDGLARDLDRQHAFGGAQPVTPVARHRL
jgi:hypothetical protein